LKARLAKGRSRLRRLRLLKAKVIAGKIIPKLNGTTTDVFSPAEKLKRRIRILKLREMNRRLKLKLTSGRKKKRRHKIKRRLRALKLKLAQKNLLLKSKHKKISSAEKVKLQEITKKVESTQSQEKG